jgi:hypothetical protein
MGLLVPSAFPEDELFSAAAAGFVVSSPALLLFCCAHSGKAKNALNASAAHQLRISFLLKHFSWIPFDSRVRLPNGALTRRAA